jgi:hypothetical protein
LIILQGAILLSQIFNSLFAPNEAAIIGTNRAERGNIILPIENHATKYS